MKMAAFEHLSPHIHEGAAKLWRASHDEMFGGAPKVVTPWPSAGRLKTHQDYDPDIVKNLLERAPEGMAEIDPRVLKSTQPWITSAGVEHYLTGEYEKTGKTFADGDNAGNVYPVIYEREHQGRVDPILLSGHHRAAAALIRGVPLRALVARGGFGPPRR
jgi:hypothetical protein